MSEFENLAEVLQQKQIDGVFWYKYIKQSWSKMSVLKPYVL